MPCSSFLLLAVLLLMYIHKTFVNEECKCIARQRPDSLKSTERIDTVVSDVKDIH